MHIITKKHGEGAKVIKVLDEMRETMDESKNQNSIAIDHVKDERITTGLSQLDKLLSGGYPRNSIILISGSPGSGKTIMCFHFIDEGVKKEENCLFLSSDSRIENIINQAENLGFEFKIAVNNNLLKFKHLNLENINMYREIEEEITDGGYKRIVLDSLSPLSEEPTWVKGSQEIIPLSSGSGIKKYPVYSAPATRMHINRLIEILGSFDCTSLLTTEIPEDSRGLSRDGISEFLVDGIIKLDLDTAMDRRKLIIRKMRATKHTLKPQNISITDTGLKFLS